jgi:DNA-binding transcriptional ArsR family regulator
LPGNTRGVIFNILNMKTIFEKKTAKLLAVLGNPFRIQILLVIGTGEACVCHLESALHHRQAYISQHLMALRKIGLLETRREGKYIFYQLSDPGILELVHQAAKLAGGPDESLPRYGEPISNCCCPKCSEPQADQEAN